MKLSTKRILLDFLAALLMVVAILTLLTAAALAQQDLGPEYDVDLLRQAAAIQLELDRLHENAIGIELHPFTKEWRYNGRGVMLGWIECEQSALKWATVTAEQQRTVTVPGVKQIAEVSARGAMLRECKKLEQDAEYLKDRVSRLLETLEEIIGRMM